MNGTLVNDAMRYLDWLTAQHALIDGRITTDLAIRDGRLWYRDIDLPALVERYGSPLEVAHLPTVTDRVQSMVRWFEDASRLLGYRGGFVYAYASKANVAEEVVRTAIDAGAHYETSSSVDVEIARMLWQGGVLPADRLIISNGFKIPAYAGNILRLRAEGFANVIPVLDNPAEIDRIVPTSAPLMVGLRQRTGGSVTSAADLALVESRFGMSFEEIEAAASTVNRAPNLEFVLYHAMLGSQFEDMDRFVGALAFAADCYARLKARHPTLRYFDFGGGVPVAYRLDFSFDYAHFAARLLSEVKSACARHHVEEPTIIGEFGRYTTADHGFHIFRVVEEKPTANGRRWYLVDGSLMVALPDAWALGQRFIVLPLSGFDRHCEQVWLGGLTCDSDDEYRGQAGGFLTLPRAEGDLHIAFFGTGAYQEMLSGVRGAHHCLMPEATELVVERDELGQSRIRVIPPPSHPEVLGILGYGRYRNSEE